LLDRSAHRRRCGFGGFPAPESAAGRPLLALVLGPSAFSFRTSLAAAPPRRRRLVTNVHRCGRFGFDDHVEIFIGLFALRSCTVRLVSKISPLAIAFALAMRRFAVAVLLLQSLGAPPWRGGFHI
jgi:hypothetical protein